MISRIREYTVVVILFLLATLVMTFPLALHLSESLAGDGGEAHEIIWNYWWFKKAIVELKQSPFYTTYFFCPHGTSLQFHDISLPYALLSIPLQFVFNLFATYNLLLLFSFILAGVGMYALAFYLTQNRIAAFIAGFIFTFSPWHISKAMGHFHLFAVEWVPFYVLYLIKTHKSDQWRDIIYAAIFFALAAYNTSYYLLYGMIFGWLYVLYFVITDECWTPFLSGHGGEKEAARQRIQWGGLIAAIRSSRGYRLLTGFLKISLITVTLLSPRIISMLIYAAHNRFSPSHNPEKFSADLLSFFVPGYTQTIGNAFRGITSQFIGGGDNTYLGYGVVVLSGVAWLRLRRDNATIRFLILAAGVFGLLSLGMHLHVLGKVTDLPLPYFWAYRFLPGLSFSGVPQRFHALTMLCLAMLSAFGAKELLSLGGKRGRALLSGALLLLIVEYFSLPFPASTMKVPEFYRQIAKDKGRYCLFDVTNGDIYGSRRNEVFYAQTVHNKKIIGGELARVSRRDIDRLFSTPVLGEILYNNAQAGIEAMPCEWRKDFARKILKKLNIRYVIVPQPRDGYPRNLIPEIYGLCRGYEDEKIVVYQVCGNGQCLSP